MKGRDGQMITELVVPADQTISIDIMSVNKDKTIFGEDAGEFRPERWMENDGELTRKARSFTTWTPLLTFLGGPR
jgi:cytochrome P450